MEEKTMFDPTCTDPERLVAAAVKTLAADFLASQRYGTNRQTCFAVTDGVQVTAQFAYGPGPRPLAVPEDLIRDARDAIGKLGAGAPLHLTKLWGYLDRALPPEPVTIAWLLMEGTGYPDQQCDLPGGHYAQIGPERADAWSWTILRDPGGEEIADGTAWDEDAAKTAVSTWARTHLRAGAGP
jgi:hypothetical protein